jgi:hypothetical protein
MNTPPQIPFVETPTNEKARVGLIVGIVSLLAGRGLPFLTGLIPLELSLVGLLAVAAGGLAAMVLGGLGLSEINRSFGQQGGKWLAIGAIIGGGLAALSAGSQLIIVVLALFGPAAGGIFENIILSI